MKTNYISLLLSIASTLTLQSCLIPWGSSGFYEPADTYTINSDKFIRERNYETDQPFTSRDQSISVPMLSTKGQVNWSTNVIHGINSNMAIAISNKMFLTGGAAYMHSHDITHPYGTFEVTHGTWSIDHYVYNTYNYQFKYDKDNSIESSSFNIGAGFYKTFSKNGRWDYFAGYSHGAATTKCDYTIKGDYYTNYVGSSYSFTEKRIYNQVFLQSDFGYLTQKTEGAIVARAAWTHFATQQLINYYDYKSYEMKKDEFVFQPTLHFAYGGAFRIFTDLGWNVPLGNNQMKWFSTNVQFGFVVKFKDKSLM